MNLIRVIPAKGSGQEKEPWSLAPVFWSIEPLALFFKVKRLFFYFGVLAWKLSSTESWKPARPVPSPNW
jgi:hypothetical protein